MPVTKVKVVHAVWKMTLSHSDAMDGPVHSVRTEVEGSGHNFQNRSGCPWENVRLKIQVTGHTFGFPFGFHKKYQFVKVGNFL